MAEKAPYWEWPRTKRIDGKTWRFYRASQTKSGAQRDKDALKKSGRMARVSWRSQSPRYATYFR